MIQFQNITGRDVLCATLSDFAATTADNYRRLLHRFVDWMHDEGLVPFSGCIAVPRAKAVAPPRSARLPASARRTPASRSATGTTAHTPCVMHRRATCSNWISLCMMSRTCSATAGLRQPRCIFPWTQNTCTSLPWRCPMRFHDDPNWMFPFDQPLRRSRHRVRGPQVRARLHVRGDLVLPTPRHGSPLREDGERRELHLLDRRRRDMCASFSLLSAYLGHKSLVETEYYLLLPNRCTPRPCYPICKEGRETEVSKKGFGGVFLGRPPPREEGMLAEGRDIVPRCAGPPHRFPR